MKEFIFYTLEGYTESPTGKSVENIQILGFEEGSSIKEAKERLIEKEPWIIEDGFIKQEIIGKQLLDDKTKNLIKKLISYNWENEQKHYEENPIPNHIFLILKELNNIIE